MTKLNSAFEILLAACFFSSAASAQWVRIEGSGTVCAGSEWWINCTFARPDQLAGYGILLEGNGDSHSSSQGSWTVPLQEKNSHSESVVLTHNGNKLLIDVTLTWPDQDTMKPAHFVLHRAERTMDGLKATCYPCSGFSSPSGSCSGIYYQDNNRAENSTIVSVWQESDPFFLKARRITGAERLQLEQGGSTVLIGGDHSTSYLLCPYDIHLYSSETQFNLTLLADGIITDKTVTYHRQAVVPLQPGHLLQIQLGVGKCHVDSPIFSSSPLFSDTPTFAINVLRQPTFSFNATGVIHDTKPLVGQSTTNVSVISKVLASGIFSANWSYNATLGRPAAVLNASLGDDKVSWSIGNLFTSTDVPTEAEIPSRPVSTVTPESDPPGNYEIDDWFTTERTVWLSGMIATAVIAFTSTALITFVVYKKFRPANQNEVVAEKKGADHTASHTSFYVGSTGRNDVVYDEVKHDRTPAPAAYLEPATLKR